MSWHLLHDGIWENLYWPLTKILCKAPSSRSLHSCRESCNVQMCFVGNGASDQPKVWQASLCRSQSHRIRLRSTLWISEVIHSRNKSWCAGKESGSKLQNQSASCYRSLWLPAHAARLWGESSKRSLETGHASTAEPKRKVLRVHRSCI